jgi:hypothetical protein
MGWGARSEGGVDIHEVELDHEKIFREPYVQTLGQLLAADMRRMSERSRTPRRLVGVPLPRTFSENP